MCFKNGCKIRPIYNIEGEKKAIYCGEHKEPEMVNVVSKTCIVDGCKKIPYFNIEGEKKAIYCGDHKLDRMVNVISKMCIVDGCKIQAKFNIEGEKKAIYCKEHKKPEMVDVINKTCKTYLCNTQIKTKYEGYCFRCYIYTFPEKPVSRNYKTKEICVVDHIKASFSHYLWITDKIINGGSSRRRPDLLLDLGTHIIIIEIDEDKHSTYECICENKRMMEISQDLGHRPIILIRFNPDGYIDENDNKIKSCWGVNKLGVAVVSKTKTVEWKMRLNRLKSQLEYWIENPTDKTVEIIQLFYF